MYGRRIHIYLTKYQSHYASSTPVAAIVYPGKFPMLSPAQFFARFEQVQLVHQPFSSFCHLLSSLTDTMLIPEQALTDDKWLYRIHKSSRMIISECLCHAT